MSKVIYTGLESSGKSLELARTIVKVAERNHKWCYKGRLKTGIPRPLVIHKNLKLSDHTQKYIIQYLKIPVIYWQNLEDLIKFEECDVFIDEVGRFFDARFWQDLSIDVRAWISMGAKTGVHIYGAAQDFSQIDKSFRLLVNEVYHCVKLLGSPRPMKTRPQIKFIWGLYILLPLDPKSFTGDSLSMMPIDWPIPRFIRKEYCEYYDTNMKVQGSLPAPYKHLERHCSDPECTFHKTLHI